MGSWSRKIEEFLSNNAIESNGGLGGKFITTTAATIPDSGLVFTAITCVEESVVTLVGNITGITTITMPKGITIFGRYTSITLGSGKAIAYQGV